MAAHLSNLLEPWLLLRLAAGLAVVILFARAGSTSLRILRHFDVARATEGQLALERQAELALSLVRVATVLQVGVLVLTMLAGDRLAASIRGAMCGYGVFDATPWGYRSLAATATTALAAGLLSELYALDGRIPGFDLVRPLARLTLLLAPLAVIDFALASAFALDLDLSVVASCCSVQLDAVAAGAGAPGGASDATRMIASIGALLSITGSIGLAALALRRRHRWIVLTAGIASVVALPFALAASIFEVAPHAFELPHHVCPFCLLRPNVFGLGYPLFGAVFLAVTWGLGASLGTLLARTDSARVVVAEFVTRRLRREIWAWGVALMLGVLPIARYAWLTGGASLFR